MNYGIKVFNQLLPVFQASVCTHYKDDFLVHDKRTLEGTAVPGLRYLFFIRPYGSQLVTVGVKNTASFITACLKEIDPARQEIHLVTVTEQGCTVRRVTSDEAMKLARLKPMLEIKAMQGSERSMPVLYRFEKGGKLIATASILARHDRQANRSLVDVGASVPQEHDRLTKMHVALLIEDCATKEAGTLFWNFGQFLVNDMPSDVWRQRVTESQDLAQPA